MLIFSQAFGLHDNPFQCYQLDVKQALAQNLHTLALRIHEEEQLLALFIDDAGSSECVFR